MPKASPPADLLEPYIGTVESCRKLAAVEPKYWDALYGDLIARVAEFLQELPAAAGNGTLLANALMRMEATLGRAANNTLPVDERQLRNFAAASAALCYDLGQTAAFMEVAVKQHSGTTVTWRPAEGITIPELGTHYESQKTSERLKPQLFTVILADRLLPEYPRKWLAGNNGEYHAWLAALNGRPKSPLTPLIRPSAPATTASKRDTGLGKFMRYIQRQLNEGNVNKPQARLHAVEEGLFLVSPGIFKDYDVIEWRAAQIDLVTAKFHKPAATGNGLWSFRVHGAANSLHGHVIDPVRAAITIRVKPNRALYTEPPPVA